ncbi:MAG: hypothetical protein GY764_14375 [Halieaceae bacterium]|nr:hypothetical protein [Halieaceae bacterium]
MRKHISAYRFSISLVLIVTIAAILRLYALDGQSFWADEGNSVALAGRDIGAIVAASAADIHPPAYYLLLRGWGQITGLDEVGARSFSALVGILLVWVIYLLGKRLRNPMTALIAAALAAINPFLVYYSQEARMYELLALCAAATAFALLLWIMPQRRKGSAAIVFVTFSILGLYTHYAFPIHLATLSLIWLIWLMQERRALPVMPEVVRWGGINVLVLVLFTPWIAVALRQLTTWPSPVASLNAAAALQETVRLMLCGPVACDITSGWYLLSALLTLALAAIAIIPRWPMRKSWLESALPLVWLVFPLAAMVLFGIFSPVFFKFLIIVVPAFLLMVAIGIDRLAKLAAVEIKVRYNRFACLLPATLFFLVALPSAPSLDRYYHDPAEARDDYRSIAAYLHAIAGANDAIILNAPGQIDAFRQYDHGAAALYPLPSSRPLDPEATGAELEQMRQQYGRIYAVYWATEQSDPEGVIERYLAENAFKAWDSWIGNLRFVAYSAQPPPSPTQFPVPPRFGEAIELDALGLSSDALQPGDIAQVLLRWTSDEAIENSYKVTLQLLDPGNQIVAQVDSEPGGGARPTSSWQPYDTVDDAYGLPIPLATPPGDYALILALYDAGSGVRLPVATGEGVSDHLLLGVMRVVPPASAPPLAVLPIRFPADTMAGSIQFLGHDRYKQGYGHAPETPLIPGDLLHLTTFWQTEEVMQGDFMFELRLDGTALGRFQLTGSSYPSSRWEPGLPWRGEHVVSLPAELATGAAHRLTMQLLGADSQPLGEPILLPPSLIY